MSDLRSKIATEIREYEHLVGGDLLAADAIMSLIQGGVDEAEKDARDTALHMLDTFDRIVTRNVNHAMHVFKDTSSETKEAISYLEQALLADLRAAQNEANAALIVRAANSHDALVEALKDARERMNDLSEALTEYVGGFDHYTAAVLNRIDAALAKAKGREVEP